MKDSSTEKLTFQDIIQYCDGLQKAYLVFTAVELDIFTHVSKEEPINGGELLGGLGMDKRAGVIFLNALCALGLLVKNKDETYANSDAAKQYLVAGSADDRRSIICHLRDTMKAWENLGTVIKTGKSEHRLDCDIFGGDKKKTEDFIWGMDNLAIDRQKEIIPLLSIDPFGKLLDLGGGPGSYAITFCKKYPELDGVVFDLPEAVRVAEQNIKKNGMEHRVKTLPGNALDDFFGSGYQTIWCSQFVHCFSEEENIKILKKCYSSMLPGGQIIIHDFFLNDLETLPAFGAMFSVHMLVCMQKSKNYSAKELVKWLSGAGFRSIEVKPVNNISSLAIAFK